ncbi:AraC family transcriptional regulator [Aureibaculum sp. A20]|uniref:AraC family transcriptional regulator n=1 Tax=Aureibaculum flavum TaxID=2795986 RepID=A0ABS0WP87_9FLAO|nr:helix-turn-helix domain-containing protein [Aureibaculum flavum]MBJ2173806.1 AraC family transcriptional regulator [Aureibaculum flavum]
MKYFYNIVFLLFVSTFFSISDSYAQDIEDNKKEYDKLRDSIGKYYKIDKRLSIEYAKKTIPLATDAEDTLKIIMALHLIGRESQFINEYHQSISYFKKELELLRSINLNDEKYEGLRNSQFVEIEVLAQLGQDYEELGQIEKAFKLYNQCVDIANRENLEFYKAVMPTIIGNLFNIKGDYKKALEKHKESFSRLNNSQNIDFRSKIFNMGSVTLKLSETYLKLNQKDSANWILKRGLVEKLDTIDETLKIEFISQEGKVYLAKKEFAKSLEYFKKANELSYQYDSVSGPSYVSLELGECYFSLKEYNKAVEVLERGIDVKKLNTKEIYLTEDYKLLAKIYKASGELEKSNKYYEKYILNQTALEKSKDTITSSFHTQELSKVENEKSTQRNTFYLFMSIGLGLLLLLIAYILYLIKQKKKNKEMFNVLLAKFNQEEKPTFEIIDTKDKVLEEKVTAEVNEETTYLILAGLQSLKEQEYFLRQDCTSYTVAKKIKTNTSYLSKVINSHFEKNFNTYINDLRINYAILRLKNDSRFRSFSVQSIAEEIGYKSADSFARYFKLSTGLNPSFYIKQLNSLGQSS